MVDSLEKAEELYAQGQLERMLLFPTEFGGQDFPQNVVYVPVGFTAAKAEIDNNVISPLIRDGKVQAYSAVPEYEGTSFIPIVIEIAAWHPESPDASRIAGTLAAWGSALERT